MAEGKKAYYITSPVEKPVRGTITNVQYNAGRPVYVTMRADDGRVITDYAVMFCTGYPTICNYWR